MTLGKIATAAAVVLALIGVILWQRAEIKDLQAANTVLSLSNDSLQKQAENNLKFIEGATTDLQTCLDSKDKLVKSFESVTQMVRRAKPVTINKDKVVDDETLKSIIDSLNRPLPAHMGNTTDGVRKD